MVAIHQSGFAGQTGHYQSAFWVFLFVRWRAVMMSRRRASVMRMMRWRTVAIGVRALRLKAGN